MKTIKIIALSLFIVSVTGIHAQPQRIDKTNVYWELVVENGDSTLQFTGKGILKINPGNSVFSPMRRSIKKIEIAEGITEIGDYFFRNWDALETVSLPKSLKIIGQQVFMNDSNIKSINLPEKIEIIRQSAFSYAGGLPDSLCLSHVTFIHASTFKHITTKYVVLPYKLDTLYNSFPSCKQLETVIIPATVKYFNGGTFEGDTALRLVVNLSPIPQTFVVPKGYPDAFYNVKCSQCRLLVPTSAVDLYKNAPIWQDFMIEGGGLSAGVSVNVKEKGNISGMEYRLYQKGEHITWKAEPVEGCIFSGWRSGDQWLSSSPELSFTITKDTMIEAVFDGTPLSLPIRSEESAEVSLYPNPAQSQFSVRSNSAINRIILYDLSGRKVLQKNNGSTVDVSGIAKGAYMVEICTETGRYMKKFVRQ